LEAPFKRSQPCRSRLDARPQPRHVNIPVEGTELPDQQRLPHLFIDVFSRPLHHPFVCCEFFQSLPVVRQTQEQPDEAEADFIDAKSKSGKKKRTQDRVERIEFPFVIHHCQRTRKEDLVLPAQFLDQSQHMIIGLEPVMVELFDRPIPVGLLKPGSQTTHIIGGFINRHFMSCFF
jgi:hypothetical protein